VFYQLRRSNSWFEKTASGAHPGSFQSHCHPSLSPLVPPLPSRALALLEKEQWRESNPVGAAVTWSGR
jgi:hypothetical protein